jgi:hypothetical protein
MFLVFPYSAIGNPNLGQVSPQYKHPKFLKESLQENHFEPNHEKAKSTIIVSPDGTGDYSTIAEAIHAAVDGDVIELLDGVYFGFGNRGKATFFL